MSNRNYKIDKEIEVTLKVKVKINSCNDYNRLNELQIENNVSDFKNDIKEHLLDKLRNSYQEEVTIGIDFWDYEVD
jgi:hypothetical protein